MASGDTCGLGCGEPVFEDGYCYAHFQSERFRSYGRSPVPIKPKPALTVEECPDTFPEEWSRGS